MENWIKRIPEENRQKASDSYRRAKSFHGKVIALMRWHPDRQISLRPIETLEEYFKYIREAATPYTWFRGESADHGDLVPGLYRGTTDDKVTAKLRLESRFFREFRRRARALVPDTDPSDTWAWYFLMQHYGGPTRLLDWTGDAAMALFFALDTKRDSRANPVVVILQPMVLTDYAFKEIGTGKRASGVVLYPGEPETQRWLTNLESEDDRSGKSMPDCPIPLLPPYTDPRITAQRSCFTLFGEKRYGFTKNGKYITCPCCDSQVVHRLIINGKKKESLRRELNRAGVSSGKVYPGLDGLTKEIREELFEE
jgi:hypothetical protein